MCNAKKFCEKAGNCKNYQPYICDELCKFEPISQARLIDEATYYWQFECMPPLKMGPSWFVNSEPYSHVPEDGRFVPTYGTYCHTEVGNDTRYYFLGYFTKKQLSDIQTIIQNSLSKI